MSTKSKLYDALLVPTLAGAIAAGGVYFVLGETGSTPIGGRLYPGWALAGGSVFAGSLLANNIGVWVLDKIPANQRFANMERMLIAPAVTGLAAGGVWFLTAPVEMSAIAKVVAVGAASEIGAQYASDIVKSTMKK